MLITNSNSVFLKATYWDSQAITSPDLKSPNKFRP